MMRASWLLLFLVACEPGHGVVGRRSADTGAVQGSGTAGAVATGTPTTGTPPGTGTGLTGPWTGVDYAALGSEPYALDQRMVGSDPCVLLGEYVAEPTATSPVLVVLSQGRGTSFSEVFDFREHLASHGVATVMASICWYTGDEVDDVVQATARMRAAADRYANGRPVIYVGEREGAVPAMGAASQDPAAIGWMGLDPKDVGGLGAGVGGDLSALGTYALHGAVGSCTDAASGATMATAAGATQLTVTGSDACDFWAARPEGCDCEAGPTPDDTRRAAIRALLTAATREIAGLDPQGQGWWTPGHPAYEQYAGVLQP